MAELLHRGGRGRHSGAGQRVGWRRPVRTFRRIRRRPNGDCPGPHGGCVRGMAAQEGHRSGGVWGAGALTWSELYTHDVAASAAFYAGLFGWEANHVQSADGGAYTMFSLRGQPAVGMMTIREEWGEIPSNWSIYLAVAELDTSLELVEGWGARSSIHPGGGERGAVLLHTGLGGGVPVDNPDYQERSTLALDLSPRRDCLINPQELWIFVLRQT